MPTGREIEFYALDDDAFLELEALADADPDSAVALLAAFGEIRSNPLRAHRHRYYNPYPVTIRLCYVEKLNAVGFFWVEDEPVSPTYGDMVVLLVAPGRSTIEIRDQARERMQKMGLG